MNFSRIWQVAAVDIRSNLKRPLFWILLIIIGLSVWGLSGGNVRIASGDSTVGGDKAWLTSEFAVAQTFTFLVFLFYSFFIAVAAGMAVIHDENLKIGEILHSTPLKPAEYLYGKFFAVLVTFVGILGIHVLLAMFFNHLVPSSIAEEIRGPFVVMNYLKPALFFSLPTIWFLLATAFAVGAWTRSPILIFVLPVALVMGSTFFLWDWSPAWLDPSINKLLMVLDPAGFRWMNETWLKVDEGVAFYNTAPVGFDGVFLLNRIWLIGLGIVALLFAQWRFQARLRGQRVSKKAIRQAREEIAAGSWSGAAVGAAARSESIDSSVVKSFGKVAGPLGFLKGALIVARAELRELRSQPGLYLFIPLIVLQAVAQATFNNGPFDAPILITPGLVAVGMMNSLTLLVTLLLLFYTVESMEREKRDGLAAIFYSTPIRTGSAMLGKSIANSFVAISIMFAGLITALIVIAIQGKVAPSVGPFLLVWGALLLPTFLVWTGFIMAAYALTGNRYTTYAIGLAAMVFTTYRQLTDQMNWVGNWYLMSVLQWSDMGTFELNQTALFLSRLMVLGLVGLFIAMTLRFFPRAERDASRTGTRLQPLSLLKGGLRLAPYAVLPLIIGIMLFVQVFGGFQGEPAEKARKDYWRRNLATWRDAKYPSISNVDLKVQLNPAKRWFRTEGVFTLVNKQEEAIVQVPLTRGEHFENMKWTLNGKEYEPEDRVGLMIFTLNEPMETNDTIEIGFEFEGKYPNGVTKNGGGTPEFILPSGVVLTSFRPTFTPLVGYQEDIGIDEDNFYESKEYPDDFYDGITQPAFGSGDRLTTRIEITGPEEYYYNSVGTRVRERTQDGMRTVLWESDYPVNFFNIVAGKWEVREGNGTTIYYHADHDYNIEEMGEAFDASRKYYSEWFMPFPWKELKLSEFPALANYAQGFPTNITFSEGIGFLTKSDPRANLAFMVTAHESAHQWWGNILLPGKGPGGSILSEGMAHFSTILLFDQVKGLEQRVQFCKLIEANYGDQRQIDSERPLVLVDGSKSGDRTVIYNKGGWVFWMLLNHMGRDSALAGVQDFIQLYSGNEDHPVLQDFITVMRPHAQDPEAFDVFVDQWFLSVVLPEYRLSNAEVTQLSNGDWRVIATIKNRGTGVMPVQVAATKGKRFPKQKPRDNELASATSSVLVGVAVAAEEDESYADVRTTVTLKPDESTTITIVSPFKPARIVVDPDAKVLQLNREVAALDL